MKRFLRHLFKPTAHGRRVLSGCLAALAAGILLFSGVSLAADADHDCTQTDCPICAEMQLCVANFELLGSSCGHAPPVFAPVVAVFRPLSTGATAYRPPALTLQSLYVRLND